MTKKPMPRERKSPTYAGGVGPDPSGSGREDRAVGRFGRTAWVGGVVMDWDSYESEATARAATADHQAIADRLRDIANLCDCDGPYSALHDFADELDPPKEA